MAAGKVDVLSRKGLDHLRKVGNDLYSNGRYSVEFIGYGGLAAQDEAWMMNRENKRDALDHEYGDVCRKRDVGELLDGRGSSKVCDGDLRYRAGGFRNLDLSDMLPAEKRRKYSPIICDKEDNKLALLSKSSAVVAQIVSTVGSPSLGNELSGTLWISADDSPGCVHSSLTEDTFLNDEQEPGQLDEEDFSHGPNLATSRWAIDDDELDENADLDEDPAVIREKRKKTTSPACSLYQQEVSDVTRGRSSGSEGCCDLGARSGGECSGSELSSNDCMDIDKSDEEDFAAGQSDSEPEDVPEPRAPEHRTRNMLQRCRYESEYEKLGKINEGSYGIVYKARDKKTGEVVALKKLKMMGSEREGFPLYYLREINNLLSFNHPSILDVKGVVVDDGHDVFGDIFMVMEYMEHDLKGLLQARKQPFSQSEVKCLMLQLLEGVKYLHDHWVLHRDLKTSNLLLNNKGELKIGDFGMSRQYGSVSKPYTALVVTLWYRAPELLLGTKEYSTAVDMWSVGCIMAELLSNKPLFDGKTEIDQLAQIFKTLGTPNEKIWPGYSKFPGMKVKFVHQPYNILHKKFPRTSFTGSPVLSDLGVNLLSKLLTYDPKKRITAEDALNHGWFREVPLPKSKEFMPTFPAQHGQKRHVQSVLSNDLDALKEHGRKDDSQDYNSERGVVGGNVFCIFLFGSVTIIVLLCFDRWHTNLTRVTILWE
ncbi:hypothetical protein Ancab_035639 [Ancistrocladus abbreviatus]